MPGDRTEDGEHSDKTPEDGISAAPSASAKVGDKTKLDKSKYPADPTNGDSDRVDDDKTAAPGAADEQATKFKRSI